METERTKYIANQPSGNVTHITINNNYNNPNDPNKPTDPNNPTNPPTPTDPDILTALYAINTSIQEGFGTSNATLNDIKTLLEQGSGNGNGRDPPDPIQPTDPPKPPDPYDPNDPLKVLDYSYFAEVVEALNGIGGYIVTMNNNLVTLDGNIGGGFSALNSNIGGKLDALWV